MSAIKLTSRYLVPFAYDSKELEFDCLAEKEPEAWELLPGESGEQDIYSYIEQLFLTKESFDRAKNRNAIACCYRHKKHKSDNFQILFEDRDTKISFYLRTICVYLFQNGVGFLCYEPEIKEKQVSVYDAIGFTNRFKELSWSGYDNIKTFRKEVVDLTPDMDPKSGELVANGTKIKQKKPFFMGDYLIPIFKSIPAKVTFYPSRLKKDGSEEYPDKALLFHYGIVDCKEDLVKAAFYLSRGYSLRYRMAEEQENLMLKPFENVRFYSTAEGSGYYACPDEDNRSFFDPDNEKLMTYFRLYLLALYQSYSLLLYSEQIAMKLSARSQDYTDYSEEIGKTLEEISTEINLFLAKSIYTSVSHVQQHNDYYNYTLDQLRVRENIESVTAGIDALQELEMYHREEDRNRKSDIIEWSLFLLSFVSVVSIALDAMDLWKKYMSSWPMFAIGIAISVVGVIGIGLFVGLIRSVIKARKNEKRKRWKKG